MTFQNWQGRTDGWRYHFGQKKTFAAVLFLKISWLIIKIFSKTFPPCGRSLANFGTGRIDGWRYHSELTPHSTTILSPHITWIPHITPQYLSLHLATPNTHTMLLCHPSIGKCKTRKVKISNRNQVRFKAIIQHELFTQNVWKTQ